MAFPVGRHMKLEVRFYRPSGSDVSCFLYYELEEGTDPEVGSMSSHVEWFYDTLGPAFAACMPSGCGVRQFIGTWKFGETYLDAVSTGAPLAGTAPSSELLPEEDAVVIQKRTNLSGRANRGRLFIPNVPETFQDNGELTAAAFTAYLNLCEVLRTQQVNGTFEPASTWNPVHANSKAGQWKRIYDCRVVRQICNKRARREPKRLSVAAAEFS